MDDDSGPTASIIFLFAFLLIDMLFYGFGAAVNLLNGKDIERRAEEEKDKKSRKLANIIGNPAEFVNTLQLVVTLIHVIVVVVYLSNWFRIIRDFFDNLANNALKGFEIAEGVVSGISVVVAFMLLLYILLTFGVLLPKKIAARIPEKWAYATVNMICTLMTVLKPFTWVVSFSVKLLLRLFGAYGKENENDVTEEEIINIVNEGHEQGVIQASEVEMITNIFEYRDKEAQDIMTHRNNIIAVDGSMPLCDVVSFILSENNSRYPVYEENMDHVIGILHLKDAIRCQRLDGNMNKPIREVEGLIREAYFVPKTKNIDELFKEMQSMKLQMAIVIDEYGQTDGLVAMEDILEEIVGNIMDEYDEDTEYIEEKSENEFVIEGKTPLEELEERFGISFEEEEFETINGLLISRLDRIPEEDEQFDVDVQGYNFKILKVENKMITSVLVTKCKCEQVTVDEV